MDFTSLFLEEQKYEIKSRSSDEFKSKYQMLKTKAGPYIPFNRDGFAPSELPYKEAIWANRNIEVSSRTNSILIEDSKYLHYLSMYPIKVIRDYSIHKGVDNIAELTEKDVPLINAEKYNIKGCATFVDELKADDFSKYCYNITDDTYKKLLELTELLFTETHIKKKYCRDFIIRKGLDNIEL